MLAFLCRRLIVSNLIQDILSEQIYISSSLPPTQNFFLSLFFWTCNKQRNTAIFILVENTILKKFSRWTCYFYNKVSYNFFSFFARRLSYSIAFNQFHHWMTFTESCAIETVNVLKMKQFRSSMTLCRPKHQRISL